MLHPTPIDFKEGRFSQDPRPPYIFTQIMPRL